MERPDAYGEAFADVYDDWYGDVTDADATARFVAARCRTGPVLELGVGTGRLARPLAAAGCDVVGIDASAAMLAGCVDPARGRPIPVARADLAILPFRPGFGAVLLAFNTLFNLPTEARQRAVFVEVASLLAPGGVLVVETTNAAVLGHGPDRSVAVSRYHHDGLTVVGAALDGERQTIAGLHLDIRAAGLRARPWTLRWSTVDQVDGFAAAAGLHRSERYGNWHGAPFSATSPSVITVYRPAIENRGAG